MKVKYPDEWNPGNKEELSWPTLLWIAVLLGLVYVLYQLA